MLESRAVTESGSKLIAWVVAAGVLGATLTVPQAVDPWEMPSLVLDRAAVSDAIEFDRLLAREAPETGEAKALRSLFLEHGRSEATPPYDVAEYERRQAAIHYAKKALIDKHGLSALDAMRARAVEDFVKAYYESRAEPRTDDEEALFGGFPEIARRYGLTYRGVIVAPELTIRTLYKARWNAIHRESFVDGFSPIELQAYWGWLALHGLGMPVEMREDALVAFRDAGGVGTQEAAALFDLLAGRPERAAITLQTLYAKRGELRLRNMALAALHAALLRAGAP